MNKNEIINESVNTLYDFFKLNRESFDDFSKRIILKVELGYDGLTPSNNGVLNGISKTNYWFERIYLGEEYADGYNCVLENQIHPLVFKTLLPVLINVYMIDDIGLISLISTEIENVVKEMTQRELNKFIEEIESLTITYSSLFNRFETDLTRCEHEGKMPDFVEFKYYDSFKLYTSKLMDYSKELIQYRDNKFGYKRKLK